MNDASVSSPAAEFAGRKSVESWRPVRWTAVIALVFALHLALIFLLGEKNKVVPRTVKNIPLLNLSGRADELRLLNDPTLFVLPSIKDFGSDHWLNPPDVKTPSFRWTEPPQPLTLDPDSLGMAFGRLMLTNFSASRLLNFNPTPVLTTPTLLLEPALPQNSTMQIEGELARRQLPSAIRLTNWPYADVLAPCVVQVLVNPAGNVVSSVLLTPCGYDAADRRALEIARALRFTPSSHLSFGRVTFNWQTVPPAASPAASP